MKYCPYCHSKLYENDDYCLNCGRMLRKRKNVSSQFNHIQPNKKPREFDVASMTPKVKLADYTHMDEYSTHNVADKLLNGWMKNHNYRSTKLTDKEMNELNKMAKVQNAKVIIGIVIFVILFLLIRSINILF